LINIRTIFLLEDSSAISSLLRDVKQIPGEHHCISLSPEASYAFERAGIPCKSLREYSRSAERYKIGLDNFQRIDRFTAILDKELAFVHNNSALTPARYAVFNLKLLFDALWNVIHILKTILDEERPDQLRLYTTHPVTSGVGKYAFSTDESIYAEVLDLQGWTVPCKIIHDTSPGSPARQMVNRKSSAVSRLISWIKGQDLVFNLGLIGKRDGAVRAAAAFFYSLASRHRKPVLIYNSGYNWDDALAELYRAGLSPVYRVTDEDLDRAPPAILDYAEEARTICSSHPAMREFGAILGIDVSSLFFERASRIIGNSYGESIHAYHIARAMIHRKKIRCLLHSVRERPFGHAIVQAARDEGIPVVSWQHGGAGYCYHPVMPFIEFIGSDWHFVFGEGVAESYKTTVERLGLKTSPVFVDVGSSSLDAFHRTAKKSPVKPTDRPVVYITTAYLQNWYTIPHPHDPSDCDEHLWQVQRQILDLAKIHPEKQFIMKFHSSQRNFEPVLSYIRNKGINNIKIIIAEKTVQELTGIADFVILDAISTAVLQVLTSDVPVFVYSGLSENDPGVIAQLKKRACTSDHPGEFTAYLEEYLQTRQVSGCPAEITNHDFLKLYGTDIHRHNSAEMAAKKLREIIH
jgi:hypothetical protein